MALGVLPLHEVALAARSFDDFCSPFAAAVEGSGDLPGRRQDVGRVDLEIILQDVRASQADVLDEVQVSVVGDRRRLSQRPIEWPLNVRSGSSGCGRPSV